MNQTSAIDSSRPALWQRTILVYCLILLAFTTLSLWAREANIVFPADMPVDYGNYIRGIQMLYGGENPYGRLEFFEPPWIAFILSPFFLLKFPLFWQTACIFFIAILIIITYRQFTPPISKPVLIAGMVSSFILPTTIVALMLGQLTPLVGLVVAWLYMRLADEKISSLEVVFGLVLISLKAHVVLLALLVFSIELMRRQKWGILVLSGGTIALLGVLSSIFFLEGWVSALARAVFVGKEFLGGEGLAAGGYFSFADLGISSLFFIPQVLYVLVLWIRKGINQYLLLLLLTLNFLLIPYSRQYDYVLLLPAWLYIFSRWLSTRRYFMIATLFLLMAFFPFYPKLYFFIPTLLFAILLFLPPKESASKQAFQDMVKAEANT
ncbi:MAG: hypothetical protein EHM40_19060 [Chloroflexi bacterium]|nr:MAG: hypothetical protein EHM40_19060 [Chloroflexota bacterium]